MSPLELLVLVRLRHQGAGDWLGAKPVRLAAVGASTGNNWRALVRLEEAGLVTVDRDTYPAEALITAKGLAASGAMLDQLMSQPDRRYTRQLAKLRAEGAIR